MFKLLLSLPTLLSSFFAKVGRRILLVIGVFMFCWVMLNLIESLIFSQTAASMVWAQSESLEEDGALQGKKQESPQAEGGKAVPAVEPEIAPTEGEEEEEEEEIEDTIIDRMHAALSGYVSASADRVDRFLMMRDIQKK